MRNIHRAVRCSLFGIAVSVAMSTMAAGSGTLWYRYSSVPDSWPTLLVDTAGPLFITVTARSTGSLALDVLDSTDSVVASWHLVFGSQVQTVVVPHVRRGVYRLKAIGDFYDGRFRFATSARGFVMPGGMDFDPEHSGVYYFYVPAGVTSFEFRLQVPDSGESGEARVYEPGGALAASLYGSGSEQSRRILVSSQSRAAWWKVQFTSGWGDFRFYVAGIPNVFAESASAWFDPMEPIVPAATHFSVSVPSNTIAGVPFEFTVTALDASGQPASHYSGIVNVTTDDPGANRPAILAVIGGVGTGQIIFSAPGTRSIHVTAADAPALNGSATVEVEAADVVPALSPPMAISLMIGLAALALFRITR